MKIPLVKGTAHRNKKPFDTKSKYLYQLCSRPFEELEEEEEGETGVLAISRMSL